MTSNKLGVTLRFGAEEDPPREEEADDEADAEEGEIACWETLRGASNTGSSCS